MNKPPTDDYRRHLRFHHELPLNKRGRDFVVGDIHGHLDLLRDTLADCGFDERQDRLIACGDLVDRGDQSVEVLDLLREPWFWSVLGNHEVMMLEWLYNGQSDYYFMQMANGGEWLATIDDDDLRPRTDLMLERCPIALSVPTVSGLVGICHTDPLADDWAAMQHLSLAGYSAQATCLWSRHRYAEVCRVRPVSLIRGAELVVCGHVSCAVPVWASNQIFIDTIQRSGTLTVVPLDDLLATLRSRGTLPD